MMELFSLLADGMRAKSTCVACYPSKIFWFKSHINIRWILISNYSLFSRFCNRRMFAKTMNKVKKKKKNVALKKFSSAKLDFTRYGSANVKTVWKRIASNVVPAAMWSRWESVSLAFCVQQQIKKKRTFPIKINADFSP